MSVVVELPKKAEKMLLNLAKERSISQEHLLQEMILQYLEDLEDARIGEQAYKEYLESGKESIPAKELYKKLGI